MRVVRIAVLVAVVLVVDDEDVGGGGGSAKAKYMSVFIVKKGCWPKMSRLLESSFLAIVLDSAYCLLIELVESGMRLLGLHWVS